MAPVLVIPVFIPHEGCPHHCIFCNQNLITSRDATHGRTGLPDAGALDQTITQYLSYKGNRTRVELAFFGGNFLGLPKDDIIRLLTDLTPYLERGLIHGIRCSTRPDTVTREMLSMTRPLGLSLVELGVQSMDDHVLAMAGRGHTREDTLRAMDRLKAAGVSIGVQLMAGLPGDTMDKAEQTARVMAACRPELARIYPVLVLSGSRLAKLYKNGRYAPLTLDAAVDQTKTMVGILEGEGVPVVRMGLQASDALCDETAVLAGPWHPAFGHLVRSALMLDQACRKLDRMAAVKEIPGDWELGVWVHPRAESRLRGDKNSNLEILKQRFPGVRFRIKTDPGLDPGTIKIRVHP